MSLVGLVTLETLCCFLALTYLFSLLISIKGQIRHFNRNRFLEMTYYLISFFLAGDVYTARVIFCVIYASTDNVRAIIIAEFAPDVLTITICSMLTYFWYTVIWSLEETTPSVKLKISIAYAVINLALIALHCTVQVIAFVFLGEDEAVL